MKHDVRMEKWVTNSERTITGPEFCAKAVRERLTRLGVRTWSIESGSPWENAYIESLFGKLRDELLTSGEQIH